MRRQSTSQNGEIVLCRKYVKVNLLSKEKIKEWRFATRGNSWVGELISSRKTLVEKSDKRNGGTFEK